MLSAYSRRSPTTTAESSPTLEKQFDSLEIPCPDDTIKSIDEGTERVGASANSVETESQESTHFFSISCGRNMVPVDHTKRKLVFETCQEGGTVRADDLTRMVDHEEKPQNVDSLTNEASSTKEENDSDCPLERINTGESMSELDIELTPKQSILRGTVAQLQVVVSESCKEPMEKSLEVDQQHTVRRSQALCRVLRGDSRDSGIGDCQMTSPLQVDELGIVSTIKEEADHEFHSREGKRTPRREDVVRNRRSSTSGILTTLARGNESDTESSRSDDKVATKRGVTKASCEINLERKGVCDCSKLSSQYRRAHDRRGGGDLIKIL